MRFVHTNIVAKDWRKLSQFYINVFNCKPKLPERNLSGNWLDKGTGLNQAKLQGIHLILPGYEDHFPTLEIFTYEPTEDQPNTMPNFKGFSHIAFEVEDIQNILEKALENGASMLGQVVNKKIEGVGILYFVYFRDPEGNIIEIQSWDK